jgi:hypothetical protein
VRFLRVSNEGDSGKKEGREKTLPKKASGVTEMRHNRGGDLKAICPFNREANGEQCLRKPSAKWALNGKLFAKLY